ncbi:hypothetical protein SH501x_003201 [Pirellulaceae bacterium SH501]
MITFLTQIAKSAKMLVSCIAWSIYGLAMLSSLLAVLVWLVYQFGLWGCWRDLPYVRSEDWATVILIFLAWLSLAGGLSLVFLFVIRTCIGLDQWETRFQNWCSTHLKRQWDENGFYVLMTPAFIALFFLFCLVWFGWPLNALSVHSIRKTISIESDVNFVESQPFRGMQIEDLKKQGRWLPWSCRAITEEVRIYAHSLQGNFEVTEYWGNAGGRKKDYSLWIVRLANTKPKETLSAIIPSDPMKLKELQNAYQSLEQVAKELRRKLEKQLSIDLTSIGPDLRNLESIFPLRASDKCDVPLQMIYLSELNSYLEKMGRSTPTDSSNNTAGSGSSTSDISMDPRTILQFSEAIENKIKARWGDLASVKKTANATSYWICYLRWYDLVLLESVSRTTGIDPGVYTLLDSDQYKTLPVLAETYIPKLSNSVYGTPSDKYIDGSIAAVPLYAFATIYENGQIAGLAVKKSEVKVAQQVIETSAIGDLCNQVCNIVKEKFLLSDLDSDGRLGISPAGFPYGPGSDRRLSLAGTLSLYLANRAITCVEALRLAAEDPGQDLEVCKRAYKLTSKYVNASRDCLKSINLKDDPTWLGDHYAYCYFMRAAILTAAIAVDIDQPGVAQDCLEFIDSLINARMRLTSQDPTNRSFYFRPLGEIAVLYRLRKLDRWSIRERKPLQRFLAEKLSETGDIAK